MFCCGLTYYAYTYSINGFCFSAFGVFMKIDLNDTAALIEQVSAVAFGAGFVGGLLLGLLICAFVYIVLRG